VEFRHCCVVGGLPAKGRLTNFDIGGIPAAAVDTPPAETTPVITVAHSVLAVSAPAAITAIERLNILNSLHYVPTTPTALERACGNPQDNTEADAISRARRQDPFSGMTRRPHTPGGVKGPSAQAALAVTGLPHRSRVCRMGAMASVGDVGRSLNTLDRIAAFARSSRRLQAVPPTRARQTS
jgi:hypothetical protein